MQVGREYQLLFVIDVLLAVVCFRNFSRVCLTIFKCMIFIGTFFDLPSDLIGIKFMKIEI